MMNDKDRLQRSIVTYQYNNIDQFDPSDTIFGSTKTNPCAICENEKHKCPGHLSYIMLEFPIFNQLTFPDTSRLIQSLCPLCYHLLVQEIPENDPDPLNTISATVRKKRDKTSGTIQCQHCGKVVSPCVLPSESSIASPIFHDSQSKMVVNPKWIEDLLNNFDDMELLGWDKTYHPRNHITRLIPIVTNRLRLSGKAGITETAAPITLYYKEIAEVVKSLHSFTFEQELRLLDAQNIDKFTHAYTMAQTFSNLICDNSSDKRKTANLKLIGKSQNTLKEARDSMIEQLKDKNDSIFLKGIIATSTNNSFRSVLGGEATSPCTRVGIPESFAKIIFKWYTVYNDNVSELIEWGLKQIKNDAYPRIVAIEHNGRYIRLKNSTDKISRIVAGDRVGITLRKGDQGILSRFPIVREESCSACKIYTNDNETIQIALSICDKIMGDFDGDEVQFYALSSHTVDAEACLCNSIHSQFLSHKDGYPCIWYKGDPKFALPLIKDEKIDIKCLKKSEPYSPYDFLESYLPKDLNYHDKKTVVKNGKLDRDKHDLMNKDFFKYLCITHGNIVATTFLDKCVQLSNDLNRYYGVEYGNDVLINKNRKQIDEKIDKMYDFLTTHTIADNMDKIYEYEAEVKELVADGLKGTWVDREGYVKERIEELKTIQANADIPTVDGSLYPISMSNNQRTLPCFPKNVILPEMQGFTKYGYRTGLTPDSFMMTAGNDRKALFIKGWEAIRRQGYLNKEINNCVGGCVIDHLGRVKTFKSIIDMNYGSINNGPRYSTKNKLSELNMSEEEFTKKFGSCKEVCEIYKSIKEIQKEYNDITVFKDTKIDCDEFEYSIDLEQFKNKLKKEFSISDADKKFIDELTGVNCWRSGHNWDYVKLALYILFGSYELTDDERALLYKVKLITQAEAGDPVGHKAALSISEPLQQLVLHAIHHTGSATSIQHSHVRRKIGIDRFSELFTGSTKAKDKDYDATAINKVSPYEVVNIVLRDPTYEKTKAFADSMETFTFNQVFRVFKIEGNVSVPDEIKAFYPNFNFGITSFSTFITVEITPSVFAGYNIPISSIMRRIVQELGCINLILATPGSVPKTIKLWLCISSTDVNGLIKIIKNKKSFPISGGLINNCSVMKNVNNGTYYVEANLINDKAYSTIIRMPEVEPLLTESNQVERTLESYGAVIARCKHYEQFIYTARNLSATSGILSRHYRLICGMMYETGSLTKTQRNSMVKNPYRDPLRGISFESPNKFIIESAKRSEKYPIADVVASNIFGMNARIGTGYTDIVLEI